VSLVSLQYGKQRLRTTVRVLVRSTAKCATESGKLTGRRRIGVCTMLHAEPCLSLRVMKMSASCAIECSSVHQCHGVFTSWSRLQGGPGSGHVARATAAVQFTFSAVTRRNNFAAFYCRSTVVVESVLNVSKFRSQL
jgi:hypothetical protein